MGQIFIYWEEIEVGDFPDCCMTCGAEDTELVPRRLETYHYRVIYGYRRFITVDLPFCQAHRSRSWIGLGRTDASEFTPEGIWLKNVADFFVEEMDAFRIEFEDAQEGHRRRKHKWKRRRRTTEDGDREIDDLIRIPRPRPAQPESSSLVPLLILSVVALPVLVVGICCLAGLMLPGVRIGGQPGVQGQPGPNFNDRPPFGPGRRP